MDTTWNAYYNVLTYSKNQTVAVTQLYPKEEIKFFYVLHFDILYYVSNNFDGFWWGLIDFDNAKPLQNHYFCYKRHDISFF